MPYADLGDPQSLNLYQFVGGNPASKTDPDGHCCLEQLKELTELVDASATEGQSMLLSARLNTVGLLAIGAYATGKIVSAGIDVSRAEINANSAYDEEMHSIALYNKAMMAKAAQKQQQSQGQTQETEHEQEPAPASGGNMKGSKGGSTGGKRFTPSDRAKDAGRNCVYCGQKTTEEAGKPNSRETDHIHPRSRGGNRTSKNRAPACRICNRSKSNKTPSEWHKD